MKKWYCSVIMFVCLGQAIQARDSIWNYYTEATNAAENFAVCLTRTDVLMAVIQRPDTTREFLPSGQYAVLSPGYRDVRNRRAASPRNVERVIVGPDVPLIYLRKLTAGRDNMRRTGALLMPSYSRWVMLLMHVPLEELVADTENLSEVDRFISERVYHPVNFNATAGVCIDWPEIDHTGQPDPKEDFITYADPEVVDDLVEIATVYNPTTQGKNVTLQQVTTLQSVLQTDFARDVLDHLLLIHGTPE